MVHGTLTARAFELVDAHGNRRAALATDPDGNPSMQLFEPTGETRIQIGLKENRPSILFMNKAGKQILILGVDPTGGAVQINDSQGVARAMVFANDDGTTGIELLTPTKTAVMLKIDSEGKYIGSFEKDFDVRPKLHLVPKPDDDDKS